MSFIWNGVSSDTMKFNVTSRQVYNAPAYDLNAIEVPGRSGDLLNPQNRFKNKQISYTGFLKASDFEGSTWREKLSTGLIQLKGWLCSDAGTYHELTDDYDPGFTRYGYISGETAISDIEDRPFGVTLTVTFNVKPFMYKAGEPMELPETKSASGSIITITDGAENTPLKSAVVNIEPVQDLHGYEYPWPGGGGVNILDYSTFFSVSTKQRCSVSVASDGTITATSTSTGAVWAGITTAQGQSVPSNSVLVAARQGDKFVSSGVGHGVSYYEVDANGVVLVGPTAKNHGTAYTVSDANCAKVGFRVNFSENSTTVGETFTGKLQIEKASSATAWQPYSNICPISGWSEVNVWVKPTYDTSLTPTATIPLGRTVYGGTLDVVRGKLVVDRRYMLITQDTAKVHHAANSTKWYTPVSDMRRSSDYAADGFICNRLITTASAYATAENVPFISGYPAGSTYPGQNWIYFSDGVSTTINEINAWLSDNPLQVVYKLATPLEYDVTPQTIKTLLGTNNIWADAGDMEIEYPVPTENPYPFGSRPLYEITMDGTGTLAVNGREWTISDYTGTLYCDTEAMEWYDASQLRNNIVSGDGWPVFEAGENSVSYTGDITKVMVTPRWRTL